MFPERIVVSVALASVLALTAVRGNAWGVDYYVTDLGTLGGTISSALGINNSGQVVGYAYTTGGGDGAFLYSGGTMQDITTLGALQSIGEANAINDSGQIAGSTGEAVFP